MGSTSLEFQKIAEGRATRIRRRIRIEEKRIRRSAGEALAYGLTGAVVAPGFETLRRHVAHKGKPPASKLFYRIGGRKVPTWVAASMISGLAFSLLPVARELHKGRRKIKKITQPQIKKSSVKMVGRKVFDPPHTRGALKNWLGKLIPESSKRHASKMLARRQGAGRVRSMDPLAAHKARTSPGVFKAPHKRPPGPPHLPESTKLHAREALRIRRNKARVLAGEGL